MMTKMKMGQPRLSQRVDSQKNEDSIEIKIPKE